MAANRDATFEGRVAVISGAGSGIGRALAAGLAARGAHLALSDVDTDAVRATGEACERAGARVLTARVDVTEAEAVATHAAAVRAHFGRVDQVYNNAGVAHFGHVRHESVEDVERVMAVNFWGVVHGTTAFLPHLIESGRGHVVNVSSLFGIVTFPGQSAYSASKFAVRGYTEALRQEMALSGLGVRVTCVLPGGIRTSVARSATAAAGVDAAVTADRFDRLLALRSPEAAARALLAGVRRGRARVLIGTEARLLDALARVAPAGVARTGVGLARVLGLTAHPGTGR